MPDTQEIQTSEFIKDLLERIVDHIEMDFEVIKRIRKTGATVAVMLSDDIGEISPAVLAVREYIPDRLPGVSVQVVSHHVNPNTVQKDWVVKMETKPSKKESMETLSLELFSTPETDVLLGRNKEQARVH